MTGPPTVGAPLARTAVVLAAALLAGCATISDDAGFESTSKLVTARADIAPQWARGAAAQGEAQQRIDELLSGPLDAERAVAVAMLGNRELRATYQSLRLAEADVVAASRPGPLTFEYLRLAKGAESMIERTLSIGLFELLTAPSRGRIARSTQQATQHAVAAQVLATAAEARRAFYRATAAAERLSYLQQATDAAAAAGELARRARNAGNLSAAEQLREQVFHAERVAALAGARHAALAARESLALVLGVDDVTRLQLPERLPDLPAAPVELATPEQRAIEQRLDLLMARAQLDATARELGLTRVTRFISDLEVGYVVESETDSPDHEGFEASITVPLFDLGSARVTRASATYEAELERVAAHASKVRSEARVAYDAYRTRYDVARQYREVIVPVRRELNAEMLLKYNGMLIGVFELLADVGAQIDSVVRAIDSLEAHWLATTDLEFSLTAGSPSGAPDVPSAAPAAAAAGH